MSCYTAQIIMKTKFLFLFIFVSFMKELNIHLDKGDDISELQLTGYEGLGVEVEDSNGQVFHFDKMTF
ncbi:hypothetical protein A3Q56_07952 [Intoshia linei]|uniref:Uncharacterized protein n=1 Tax=Intoshia linei TaxID=1819745 RepID=A0A177AQP9_9BILA|nr:hypothetical protein A3Q56_07952 [Intoshia linei]